MPYRFLSPEWMTAVQALRSEAPAPPAEAAGVCVNLVVTGGPDGDIDAHLVDGQLETGRAASAQTTVSLPFASAKRLIVDGDPAAALQAVMSGELKIEGNVMNLLRLQETLSKRSDELAEFQEKVRSLTE